MRLVGVDGCRAGWVAASCDVADVGASSLSAPTFSIQPSFGALLASLDGHRALIAVDIPIGLPSGGPPQNGRRRADAAARALLGAPRSSSVFPAPCRDTLEASSYHRACELERNARGSGKGLSRQGYGILAKIREVDRVVTPAHQAPLGPGPGVWVREVHPEVAFARLSTDGRGLTHPKRACKTCRGIGVACPGETDRLTLLREYVADFEPGAVRERLLREHSRQPGLSGPVVGRDDVVDAVVCLVTALRIARGEEQTLPEGEPECDARGLRMEIVA